MRRHATPDPQPPAWLDQSGAREAWVGLAATIDTLTAYAADKAHAPGERALARERATVARTAVWVCRRLAPVFEFAADPAKRASLPRPVYLVLDDAALHLAKLLPEVSAEPEAYDINAVAVGRALLQVLMACSLVPPRLANALAESAAALAALTELETAAIALGEGIVPPH